MQSSEIQTMTEAQATDEAVLLLIRKLMRWHPDAYADTMRRMPNGAREQIQAAERRADTVRDRHGIGTLAYPVVYDEIED